MQNSSNSLKLRLRTSSLRAYTMLGALVLIWLFFHWQTGLVFLTPRNLSNLMLQTSVTGIIAVGMLMVIVSGNIDLSVGSLLALSGGVGAILLVNLGLGLVPSILAAIAVGVAIGLLQGSLTAYARIPAFIVTLGGLLAWRGAIKGISQSETIPIADERFTAIGQSYIVSEAGWGLAAVAIAAIVYFAVRRARVKKEYDVAESGLRGELLGTFLPIAGVLAFIAVMNAWKGIPVPVLIFLTVALAGYFITTNTTFGRYIYAVGGNSEAARLSGINNKAIVLKVFALLGGFVGIAALIYTARVASASPDAGTLLELDAIAACVIGGTSLMGGRGTVFGACLGALIMTSLDNGMSLLNLPDYTQEVIKGSILVAAVGVDMIGKRSA
ncbi:MAG: sugar ABC transporter permease [Acidobacteriota bacterium]|nr:MAG: sugar ABC transporter permease [Acidobacteriota bacterium]